MQLNCSPGFCTSLPRDPGHQYGRRGQQVTDSIVCTTDIQPLKNAAHNAFLFLGRNSSQGCSLPFMDRDLHLCPPSRDDSESLEPNWLHLYSWDLSTNMNRIVPYKWSGLNPFLHACDTGGGGGAHTCFAGKNWGSMTCPRSSPAPHGKASTHLFSTVLTDSLCSSSWMTLGRRHLRNTEWNARSTWQTFSCYAATALALPSFKYSSTCFGRQTKRQTLSIMRFLFSGRSQSTSLPKFQSSLQVLFMETAFP